MGTAFGAGIYNRITHAQRDAVIDMLVALVRLTGKRLRGASG